MIDAVVFDLDGVILETEALWNEVREGLTRERGGRWSDQAQADMMGMSSTEWSRYMHEELGVPDPPEEISGEVVRRMAERYAEGLPLIDGAVDAVKRLAARWPLALASSANRLLIDRALELSGLVPYFRVTVSSEEVARGKPAPDVYLEAAAAARRGADPVCGDRGLGERDPLGARGRNARRRDPESRLSSTRGRAPARGCHARLDPGARARDHRVSGSEPLTPGYGGGAPFDCQ